jgi:hypothetical protein
MNPAMNTLTKEDVINGTKKMVENFINTHEDILISIHKGSIKVLSCPWLIERIPDGQDIIIISSSHEKTEAIDKLLREMGV